MKKVMYLCEKVKRDKDGFRETMWLHEPCEGWRIVERKTVKIDERGTMLNK